MKLFPGGDKSNPQRYDEEVDGEKILKFIHQNSTHKFNLEVALKRYAAKEQKLITVMKRAQRENFPNWKILQDSPCGPQQLESFVEFIAMSKGFGSVEDSTRAYQHFLVCTKEKGEEMKKFWNGVIKTANTQLGFAAGAQEPEPEPQPAEQTH